MRRKVVIFATIEDNSVFTDCYWETRVTGGWHLSTSFYVPSPDPHLELHEDTKENAQLRGMRFIQDLKGVISLSTDLLADKKGDEKRVKRG